MFRSRHTSFALAAAAAALLAPSPTFAVRHTVYAVELEGTYTYSAALDHREKGFRRQTVLDAQGVFVSERAELSFLDGAADDTPGSRSRADLDVLFRSKGKQVETTVAEGGVQDQRVCEIEDRPLHGQRGRGWVQQSLLQPLVPGAPVAMDARITDVLEIPFKPSARCPAGTGATIGSAAQETLGRLDAEFELPRESTTAGKTIQLLRGPSHEACPGSESPESVGCAFRWEATVTMTKVLDEELGDQDPAAPAPAPAPVAPAATDPARTPGPAAPVVPPRAGAVAPAAADASAPRQTASVPATPARTDRGARTLSFQAACLSGCSGTALLSVRTGTKSVRRTFSVTVEAGPQRAVSIALPKAVRTALRHGGKGRLEVRLTTPAGAQVRRALAVRATR